MDWGIVVVVGSLGAKPKLGIQLNRIVSGRIEQSPGSTPDSA
jgi:hypothetical protein